MALEADDKGKYTFLELEQPGELVVRGPQVMKGYYNNPEETAETIDAAGWLHTGDIAKMDADGYFSIVDRKKDLIIASGFNIVPREVEEVLFMHPKVMEAAVVGVPDPKRGETVKAFVVLKAGETSTAEEIRAFCKENLAPYKVPALVEFTNESPRPRSGKCSGGRWSSRSSESRRADERGSGLALLQGLVAIPSLSHQEAAASAWLPARCRLWAMTGPM